MGLESEETFEETKNRRIRQRLTVTGVVQGVGFRPFVYGLALANDLGGFVGNDSQGVFIEVEGEIESLTRFRQGLLDYPPPLAHIENISVEAVEAQGEYSFRIVHSQAQSSESTLVSPDICICADCYRELLDPSNRRYGYPFINCTNCGPRFTIIRDIPYDRPLTTMADFPMCAECQGEYENPFDRRFHAQPNACSNCGPQVWLEYSRELTKQERSLDSNSHSSRVAIAVARQLLQAGKIVAVKGLGGFHLACNALDTNALRTLRDRKGRVDKPFAVMALDVKTVKVFAELTVLEEEYLCSKERPILLLRKKENDRLSHLVAPGNQYVGVMLPYTPLHYLLLQPSASSDRIGNEVTSKVNNEAPSGSGPHQYEVDLPVLVMTSGNYSDEPIVKDHDEARDRLAGLADAFLFHNRGIYARCDDSVIRIVQGLNGSLGKARVEEENDQMGMLLPIRRSRGYAPFPVKLPFETAPVLAVGGELKATFCLAKGRYAYMSQHIGDMENLETLEAFDEAVSHFKHIFRAEPQSIVCDLHPRYLSSKWAHQQRNKMLPVVTVQHHHAHIASVMAEHQLDGKKPVIGFSFDGTGYGTDGAVWGGEVLIADYQEFERASFLRNIPLVGGDTAVKRPYRLALSHLKAAGIAWDRWIPSVQACSDEELKVLEKQIEMELNTVPTSSMGRLFDAVASIAGVRQTVSYEAQAAIEFESLASSHFSGSYQFAVSDSDFDAAPVIEEVVRDVLHGVDIDVISAKFHRAVAEVVLRVSYQMRERYGLFDVALSGGVFQNVSLLTQSVSLLKEAGFSVYCHQLVPPNDGGLALGQVAIATQRKMTSSVKF